MGEQPVIFGVCCCREPGTVLTGGDDHFELAAEIGDHAGEDLVCAVGKAGKAGDVWCVLGQVCPDGFVYQVCCGPGRPRCPEMAMRCMRALTEELSGVGRRTREHSWSPVRSTRGGNAALVRSPISRTRSARSHKYRPIWA